MASETAQRIAAHVKAGEAADAIRLCEASLESDSGAESRPHIAATLCICLAGAGRTADASAAFLRFHADIRRAEEKTQLRAAIAARHGPSLQEWFRRTSSMYHDQPVGFSPISTLAAWSARRGITPIVIDAAAEVQPAAVGRPRYTTDPYTCYRLPGGEFVSGWDFAFADGQFLEDSGYMRLETFYGVFPYALEESLNLLAHIWTDEVEDVAEDALFLSCPRAFHVGHFMVDFLPRLRSLGALAPDVKIAIAREVPAKFIELLKSFGIRRERLVPCRLGKRYRFRNLFVAQVGELTRPNPNNIAFLRNTFAPKERIRSDVRGFFLDRGIGTRRIVNQEEVDRVLDEFDILHINLEEMKIKEQRQALAQAEILIGIYGSDLLACLLTPAGGHAIELIWMEPDTTVEWCVCSGLRHQHLKCDPAPETGEKRMKKDRDLIVDCDELRRRLRAIVQA